jgi:type II secretory pathway pseudopilin PulG
MKRLINRKDAFTLIETLLIIAIITILATIVIIAINPVRQFAQTRNTQRQADIKAILDAVFQYLVDNKGLFPTEIDENLRMLGTATSGCAVICENGNEINNGDQGYWYNSNWQYRKEITVSNNIEGYQTLINVSKSSGGDVTCEGNCNDDFSDLRFTNSSSDELIPYWIERKVDGDYAMVWVNNKWNETTLYMYYGNSDASCDSSSSDTFPVYFDDWISDNRGDWQNYNRGSNYHERIHKTVDVDGGRILTINGVFSAWNYGNWDWSWIGFSDDKDTRLISCDNAVWIRLWHRTVDVDDTNHLWFSLYSKNGGSQSNTDKLGIPTSYLNDDLVLQLRFSDDVVNYTIKDENGLILITDELTTNVPNSNNVEYLSWGGLDLSSMPHSFLNPGWRISNGSTNGGCTLDIDNLFIGKYNLTEPSFVFGEEKEKEEEKIGQKTEDACLDLSPLLAPTFINSIPYDPKHGSSEKTYYAIKKTSEERIVISACGPELEKVIEIRR